MGVKCCVIWLKNVTIQTGSQISQFFFKLKFMFTEINVWSNGQQKTQFKMRKTIWNKITPR